MWTATVTVLLFWITTSLAKDHRRLPEATCTRQIAHHYEIYSELTGIPLRSLDEPYLGKLSNAWFQAVEWLLLRFTRLDCCRDYTLIKPDVNYVAALQFAVMEELRVSECTPELDVFPLFHVQEERNGNGVLVKSCLGLLQPNGTDLIAEWSLNRIDKRTKHGFCGEHFLVEIAQETLEETWLLDEFGGDRIIKVKDRLEKGVTRNDQLVWVFFPVTLGVWIYLASGVIFRTINRLLKIPKRGRWCLERT